jgi:hypothetical protein
MTPISVFEEHSAVLANWSARGFQDETVVCFDRHLDLKKIADEQVERLKAVKMDPAAVSALERDFAFRDDGSYVYGFDNFVFAAAALGYISRFVWVVPEPVLFSVVKLTSILWNSLSLVPDYGNEIIRTVVMKAHSARCIVNGATVEITTLRRLASVQGLESAHIDVDLDFFCERYGHCDHSISELVAVLRAASFEKRFESLALSINSGFLPESARGWVPKLGSLLGRSIRAEPDFRAGAPKSLAALGSGEPLNYLFIEELWAQELMVLGSAGWALRAVLESRSGNYVGAALSYDTAQEGGDRAAWAAYSLGLAAMERREYGNAVRWFKSARFELVDNIHSHALICETLCLVRERRFEEALPQAEQCVQRLPMRKEGYILAARSAAELGQAALAKSYRQRQALLESKWQTLTFS